MRNLPAILVLAVFVALPAAAKPKLVIVCAEVEYKTEFTVPSVCEQNLSELFDIHVVHADPANRNLLIGGGIIADADVLLLTVRRRALPKAQLDMIRKHIDDGKPVIGIRTTSHAFALRGNMEKPKGHDTWDTFDADILGGSYSGHGGKHTGTDVRIAKSAKKDHSILRGVSKSFQARSSLYFNATLKPDCKVLLTGKQDGKTHPVAWTRKLESGSRVFYTSLGHVEDFEDKSMRRAFINGICWAAEVEAPKRGAVYKPYAEFAEPDFPFLTSILDAGTIESKDGPSKNLTIRGVVIKVSDDVSACYDTDLCRLAAVWRGGRIKTNTMAPNSYSFEAAAKKSPGGFGPMPTVDGKLISQLGMYPGFGSSTADPRPMEPFPEQPGRGPVDAKLARWGGIQLTDQGPIVSYTIGERLIRERLTADGKGYVRHVEAGPGPEVLIKLTSDLNRKISTDGDLIIQAAAMLKMPASKERTVRVAAIDTKAPPRVAFPQADAPGPARWQQVQHSRSLLSFDVESNYTLRDIGLPFPNTWRRNVRTAGIDFFDDGRAAIVTFDGDVWLVDELDNKMRGVTWKRFASGMYESLNLSVVDGKIYVFHRNEITRLHDYNNDGTADYYENFCNIPVQSPESREFPLDIVKRPGGGFYIAKGGQQNKDWGVHGGTILAISADGRTAEVVATHTREAYLGIHPKSGHLFGSDQQGHFVPSTPIYGIQKGDKFGFAKHPKGRDPLPDYEPTQPIMWVPHRVLQSGAHLVWPTDKRFGPLSDRLLCLDYYKPGLGVVLCDPDKRERGGAVYRIDLPARSGLQHAAINPKDGLLYIVGFTIWGSKGERVAAFSRLEPRKGPDLFPTAINAYQEGVRIAFSSPINAASLDPESFAAERWNYKRGPGYGSPHYTLGGEKGQDALFVQSLTPSKDGKSVFIRIADMRVSDQLQVRYKLKLKSGDEAKRDVWLTPRQLPAFSPADHGFGALAKSRPVRDAITAVVEPTVALGKAVSEKFGCIACHSNDGTTEGRIGPTWKGLAGSKVAFTDGNSATADAAFIKESILEPTAKVRKGFDKPDAGMPSYAGVLKPHELESVVLYIHSLK
jgi:type 1 glutamine amidotransferase/cytochrome c2